MNDTLCNGGKCDRRYTCKYAHTADWTHDRIFAVKPGEPSDFYEELPSQRVVTSGSNNTVIQVTPGSTVIFKD